MHISLGGLSLQAINVSVFLYRDSGLVQRVFCKLSRIERAVVLGTTELIQPEDLPETLLEKQAVPGVQVTQYHQVIKETKRRLVLEAFQESCGNYAQCARLLGMHPNNLHRLIRNLDLKLNTAPSF